MAKEAAVASVRRRVRLALGRAGLAPGGRLVVAVSGGPDSLAMLHALVGLRSALDLTLHGAHLDHCLRGDASREDAAFVARTFRESELHCTVEHIDIIAYREARRLSLEDAARRVRYDFLARVASDQGADAVAVAHTSDDQAETVLMHVMRGSGLTGLRGMAELTHGPLGDTAVTLVRPMLSVSRRDAEAYCRALGLKPRVDETNLSLEQTRNRVRSELLPMMERYNPAVREALVRLSRTAGWDADYIEAKVDEAWERTARLEGTAALLDREAFEALPLAIRSHLLRRAVKAVKGNLEDVEQSHIDDMARLMVGSAGRSLDLPGGTRFTVSYADARIAPRDSEELSLPGFEGEHALQVPGESLLPGWRVLARIFEQSQAGTHQQTSLSALFDCDSVGQKLRVRIRQPGDRFQPLGMSQTKKLQDFMVDSKVPRSARDRVPLVVSERGIAWVVGWRIAEWATAHGRSPRSLELRFLQPT